MDKNLGTLYTDTQLEELEVLRISIKKWQKKKTDKIQTISY